MDAHRRQELVRVAAPLAFLLVATIAVLLVRSSLHHHAAEPAKKPPAKHRRTQTQSAVVPLATGTGTTAGATTAAVTATSSGQTYTVAAGDTLGSIATKEHTTVDALLAANPGIDPTGLQIGDTIQVP